MLAVVLTKDDHIIASPVHGFIQKNLVTVKNDGKEKAVRRCIFRRKAKFIT